MTDVQGSRRDVTGSDVTHRAAEELPRMVHRIFPCSRCLAAKATEMQGGIMFKRLSLLVFDVRKREYNNGQMMLYIREVGMMKLKRAELERVLKPDQHNDAQLLLQLAQRFDG